MFHILYNTTLLFHKHILDSFDKMLHYLTTEKMRGLNSDNLDLVQNS